MYDLSQDQTLHFYFKMSEKIYHSEIEGVPFAWQKTGQGKPLVILHGWGSSSQAMLPLANKLADIRTCYLIDFPGFGQSPEPPAAFSVDDYANIVKEFIVEMNLNTPDLLVHSFGARVALKLCADPSSPELAKILITGGAGMKPKRSAKFYFKKYLAKLLKSPFYLAGGNLREKGLRKLRSTSLWKKLGSSDYRQLSGVMRETFVKTVSEHLDDLLPAIDHEILLLWGENDDATPLYQAKIMEGGLKNSALVTIKNAGHYAFLDQQERFIAIARAFYTG